jgi:hypothetical protein
MIYLWFTMCCSQHIPWDRIMHSTTISGCIYTGHWRFSWQSTWTHLSIKYTVVKLCNRISRLGHIFLFYFFFLIRNKTGDIQNKNLRAVMVMIVWWLDLQLPTQSVSINTNVVSSNLTQAIQHYVIKFVSDLLQVGGFLQLLRFPPPIKLTTTI